MEDQWLAWTKRLQALASTGSYFGESDYDVERYDEIHAITNQMLAALGNVPLTRIEGLIPDYAKGYVTPKVDVRCAIIRGQQILMVQERADSHWTLPGGFCDVGYSAAENAEKEVWEESGLTVKANKLYGIFHKAKHAYPPDHRDFYKFYFLCEEVGNKPPKPGPECLDAGFFPRNELPRLSTTRAIAEHIDLAFECAVDPSRFPIVD